MNGVIYLLTAPDGRRYVGRTVDFPRRMRQYRNHGGHGKVGVAIAEHGWESFSVSIIARGISDEALPRYELACIALLKPELNLSTQRGGRLRHSESTKRKMSEAKRGKSRAPFTPETRARMRAAHRGRKQSAECVAKRAAKLRGRPAWNRGKAQSNRGVPKSPEHRAKIAAGVRRAHGHPF